MSACRALLIGLVLVAPLGAAPSLWANDDWPLGQLLPDGRLAWARVPDGRDLVDDLPASLIDRARLPGSLGPVLEAWRAEAGDGALGEVLGGPSELAVYQTEGGRLVGGSAGRELLLVTRPADGARARARLDELVAACADADMPTSDGDYRGVAYRRLGRELVVAWMGHALVVATNDELLADAVDRSRDPTVVRAPAPPPQSVELGLSLDALHRKDFKGLRAARRRSVGKDALPALELLLGPLGEQLAEAGWAQGTLVHDAAALTLEVNLPTTGEGVRAAPAPMDLPVSEHTLAALALRVDLADVWRRREVLASQAVQSRLARLDSAMTMLFAGRSLAEDVFSQLAPEVAVVVDGKAFGEDDAVPALRLPAACLVARLKPDAQHLLPLVLVAFQGALGVNNMERAQEGSAPFLLSSTAHRGVTLHAARLLSGEGSGDGSEDDPLSADFNLTPCLAVVGERLLLGTSTAQVRRLVDALLDGRTRPVEGLVWLEVDGPALGAELFETRAPLAARLMLLRGDSVQQAIAEVDRWVAELGDAGQLEGDVVPLPGSLRARLTLRRPVDGED